MKVYSPTQTEKWLDCPLLRELEYNGHWVPREMGNSDLAKIAGSAFASACASLHLSLKLSGPSALLDPAVIKQAIDVAHDELQAEARMWFEAGRSGPPDMVAMLFSELAKSIPIYAAQSPLKDWKEIWDVELALPDHGNCRLDVTGVDKDGVASVADNKYTRSIDTRYVESRLQEYKHKWQFMHYRWAASEFYGRPIHRYHVLLMVNSHKRASYHVYYEGNQERDMQWLMSARQHWMDMEAEENGERIPAWGNPNHKNGFGWCPMLAACMDYMLDPILMQQSYIQIEKPREKKHIIIEEGL